MDTKNKRHLINPFVNYCHGSSFVHITTLAITGKGKHVRNTTSGYWMTDSEMEAGPLLPAGPSCRGKLWRWAGSLGQRLPSARQLEDRI